MARSAVIWHEERGYMARSAVIWCNDLNGHFVRWRTHFAWTNYFGLSGAVQTVSNSCRPCLLYTSPSPRDVEESRMPSSA